mmetsp:Transcript_9962/g.28287  ORF Transcript_9962/g.28287 Transcript_9962/m.28287 type:complete len:227 (+) Transcript_9962:341-1021(+)
MRLWAGARKEVRPLDGMCWIRVTQLHQPDQAFGQFVIRASFDGEPERHKDLLEVRVLHEANSLLGEVREGMQGDVKFHARVFGMTVQESGLAGTLDQERLAVVARYPGRHTDLFQILRVRDALEPRHELVVGGGATAPLLEQFHRIHDALLRVVGLWLLRRVVPLGCHPTQNVTSFLPHDEVHRDRETAAIFRGSGHFGRVRWQRDADDEDIWRIPRLAGVLIIGE